MRVRSVGVCKAAPLVAASLCVFASAAFAEDIQVPLDQVRIVAFQAPVKTVFVGNPAIADITVIDPTHIFVMGKNFGTTNIITLDEAGHESSNQQISVLDRPGSTVTVQRGAAQTTLSCTSQRCVSAPTPGDDKAPFDAFAAQIEKREEIASKAAGGGSSGQ